MKKLVNNRGTFTAIAVVCLIVAIVVVGQGMALFSSDSKPAEASPSPKTVVKLDESVSNPALEKCASTLLQKQGFEADEFKVGSNVDPKLDKTEPGKYVFGERIRTPQESADFFASGTTEATVALNTAKASEGFSKKFLTNPKNAVSIQLMTDFVWPGNTGFVSGDLKIFGEKMDPAGTIGVLYIAGCDSGKEDASELEAFAIRGACNNPQMSLPTPPKQKQKCVEIPNNGVYDCGGAKTGSFHGGGVPQGSVSGSGGPPVKVKTTQKGGGGVVDSPTKPPGSETGGQAGGGATKPDPDRNPPPPATGGNDGSGGDNQNPF